MRKTIFITGTSSGIGKATAHYFLSKGWQVAATMRKPEKVTDLPESNVLKKYQLDVQNEEEIQQAIAAAIEDFGKIDVVLNNAGYGVLGPMEYATSAQYDQQFDVNVKGVFNVTKHLLPHFRKNKRGRILNVSSMGGRTTFPFFSLYCATKFAVEGLSESLNYELNEHGIDVKLIEPGGVQTDFTGRSMVWLEGDIQDYEASIQKIKHAMENATTREIPSTPEAVAKVIYEAATTSSSKMRFVVGRDAKTMLAMRKLLGVKRTMKIVRGFYKM
ncbi:MAG: SDR family oxidoreductase [Thermonemataceae bacterium]